MDKERSGGEGLLQDVKGFCGSWSPGQRLGFIAEEACEWVGDGAVVLDEASVEIGEAEETLEFLHCSGCGPVLNSCHLPLVHPDTTVIDVVAKELH